MSYNNSLLISSSSSYPEYMHIYNTYTRYIYKHTIFTCLHGHKEIHVLILSMLWLSRPGVSPSAHTGVLTHSNRVTSHVTDFA